MNERMKLNLSVYNIAGALALLSMIHTASADGQKFEAIKQIENRAVLDLVDEYTGRICKEIPLSGEVFNASVEATFNSLMAKLLPIGWGLKGHIDWTTWKGLPADQVSQIWKENSECRKVVSVSLIGMLVRIDPQQPMGEEKRSPAQRPLARRQECDGHYANLQNVKAFMRQIKAELEVAEREERRLDNEMNLLRETIPRDSDPVKAAGDIKKRGNELIVRTRENGAAIKRAKERIDKHNVEMLIVSIDINNCVSEGVLPADFWQPTNP